MSERSAEQGGVCATCSGTGIQPDYSPNPELVPCFECDPYDKPVQVQGHSHSEPICAWPDCQTYLTRDDMRVMQIAQRPTTPPASTPEEGI